jgi:hypothetical protein
VPLISPSNHLVRQRFARAQSAAVLAAGEIMAAFDTPAINRKKLAWPDPALGHPRKKRARILTHRPSGFTGLSGYS